MRKKAIISLFFVAAAASYFFGRDNAFIKKELIHLSGATSKLKKEINKDALYEEVEAECELPSSKEILESENLWSNIHFKKNGEIFRIRLFTDEGKNGSFRKLVYMKEDLNGFPDILKKIKISPELDEGLLIKKYLDDGEIIYKENAISFGNDFFAKFKNGKISEIQGPEKHCVFTD